MQSKVCFLLLFITNQNTHDCFLISTNSCLFPSLYIFLWFLFLFLSVVVQIESWAVFDYWKALYIPIYYYYYYSVIYCKSKHTRGYKWTLFNIDQIKQCADWTIPVFSVFDYLLHLLYSKNPNARHTETQNETERVLASLLADGLNCIPTSPPPLPSPPSSCHVMAFREMDRSLCTNESQEGDSTDFVCFSRGLRLNLQPHQKIQFADFYCSKNSLCTVEWRDYEA